MLSTPAEIDGGYAESTVAEAQFCFPFQVTPICKLPLLCAGLVGYRSFKMTGDTERLGFWVWCCRPHSDSSRSLSRSPSLCFYSDWRYASTTICRNWVLCGLVVLIGYLHSDWMRQLSLLNWIASASCPQSSCQRRRCGLRWHPHDDPSFPYEMLWEEKGAAISCQPDS